MLNQRNLAIQINPLRRTTQRQNLDMGQEIHSARLLDFSGEHVQPKSRTSVIKINKAKLPADFFPKTAPFQRRMPQFKSNTLIQQSEQMSFQRKRIGSEKLHLSHEKTSFFGFFDSEQINKDIQNQILQSKKNTKKRMLETRQQSKRQNMKIDVKRRFTPGAHTQRVDLLDMLPSSEEPPSMSIVVSNNSTINNPVKSGRLQSRKKAKARGNHRCNQQQQQQGQSQQQDPQKSNDLPATKERKPLIEQFTYDNMPKKGLHLRTIDSRDGIGNSSDMAFKQVDIHNITFFNAKSKCLPPIKKKH